MHQFKFGEYVYPKRLPWRVIFQDIDQHLKAAHLAELVGLGWSSFQSCRDSPEPRHSIALSILVIHTRYCGEELTNQRITEAK